MSAHPHHDRPLTASRTPAWWQSPWARSDWGLLIAAGGLSLMGALLVWSATTADHGTAYLLRHLFNTAVGVSLAAAVTRLDFRTLRALAPWLAIASALGLVLVLTPLGTTINGSHSWIRVPGGMSIQPSEFAKAALCIALALILAERWERGEQPGTRDVLLSAATALVPIVLVMLQPDLGSTLVLVALTAGVVAASGAPKRWLAGAAALGAAGIALALLTPVLSPYQRDRLIAFADPSADPSGIGYQTRQVRIAIGSGGWQGQGLFEGRQTQGGFIPFQQTDFIFSVAGEELGFLGAGALLLVLGFLIVRILVVGAHARDAFGRLLAVGVATWFAFQTFENVGMNLGLMPVTGLPLPFVSYGGSSMFACWLAIGLVNNCHVAAQERPGRR
ncbi:rod shape-determining protein RodA [Actinomycetota bacterium]